MTQLLDRAWCRIFHKRFHMPQETMYGWQFVYCLHCKVTWPERRSSPATGSE